MRKFINSLFPASHAFFANIAAATAEAQIFVNIIAIDEAGCVQLAPFGDFYNVDSQGKRVIQRFQKPDAEAIVNEFNSLLSTPQRLLGLPWYVGHPDHARFKGQHLDSKAYGRIKKLEIRDDGLYANVKFGAAGKQLLEDEAFHGHSVNWRAVPSGSEKGMTVFRPVSLKSVGFTNDPQIPVRPASLANEETEEELPNDNTMIIPPKLKLIAGFKADEDVTMEQILAALEKLNPTKENTMANEKNPIELTIGEEKFSVVLANEESAALPERITKLSGDLATEKAAKDKLTENFANERRHRATFIVEKAIADGRLLAANKETAITELCNAGDGFDAKSEAIAKATPVVKTVSKTGGLGGKGAEILANVRDRQVKFDTLLRARAEQFPNESYDVRFAVVSNSSEGQALLAQMNQEKEAAAAA